MSLGKPPPGRAQVAPTAPALKRARGNGERGFAKRGCATAAHNTLRRAKACGAKRPGGLSRRSNPSASSPSSASGALRNGTDYVASSGSHPGLAEVLPHHRSGVASRGTMRGALVKVRSGKTLDVEYLWGATSVNARPQTDSAQRWWKRSAHTSKKPSVQRADKGHRRRGIGSEARKLHAPEGPEFEQAADKRYTLGCTSLIKCNATNSVLSLLHTSPKRERRVTPRRRTHETPRRCMRDLKRIACVSRTPARREWPPDA